MKDDDLKVWGRAMDSRLEPNAQLKGAILNQILFQAPATAPAPRRGWFWATALASLALAMMAALCFLAERASNGVNQLVGLGAVDIAELRAIGQELNRSFPEGLSWVSKVGEALDICPAPGKGGGVPSLMIRQVVLRQVDGAWRQVYVADILARPDEPVESHRNYLWAHRLETGLYAVEGKTFVGAAPVEFAGGQRLNEPTLLATTADLRVYQTVIEI